MAVDERSLREAAIDNTRVTPFKAWRESSWARIVRVYERTSASLKLSKLLEYGLGKCKLCNYRGQCPQYPYRVSNNG